MQVANVLLLLAKAFAYYYSHSKAVLASTADSFVDIASQVCSLTCVELHSGLPDIGIAGCHRLCRA